MKIIASKPANNFTSNNNATWNRPRSLAELRTFVTAHDEELEVEVFEL